MGLTTRCTFLESKSEAIVESSILGYPTIRHGRCELLLSPGTTPRCWECENYRKSLHSTIAKQKHRLSSDCTDPSSHTNYSHMATSELCSRLHNLHAKCRKTTKQLNCLKKRIEILCEEDEVGIIVDDHTHNDLKSIIEENDNKVASSSGSDSFTRIFWDQQKQAAAVNNAKHMKWHPMMIKWCLYLRHLSGSAYDLLRGSGSLKLPSQRTLRDYTYTSTTTIGFSADIDTQLMQAVNIITCMEREKYVGILVDEMHVKEDLVFDKHRIKLLGFLNLGDTNNQLLHFEKSISAEEQQEQELAKTMLVLMVRGLFSSLCFPYAQFASSTTAKGDLLIDPVWEAVMRLECLGLKVLYITADGATSNRRFFKLHNPASPLVHKTENPYDPDRFVYFISDPPHLLKTARNCWSKNKLWVSSMQAF